MNRFEIVNNEIVSFLGFDDYDDKTTLFVPNGPTKIKSIDISGDDKYKTIEYLVISKTIIDIDRNAFKGFKNITNIKSDSDAFIVENNCLFSKDKKTLYLVGKTIENATKLPNDLTYICDEAFANCKKLRSVIIPDSVSHLGASCFENCRVLSNVRLPESLLLISEKSFYLCESLKEITIPKFVKVIDDNAFSDCYSLENVNICSINLKEVGNYCFEECCRLMRIDFLNGLERIGDYCFGGCKRMTELSIPQTIKKIGRKAFYECNNLSIFSKSEYVKSYCNGHHIIFEED